MFFGGSYIARVFTPLGTEASQVRPGCVRDFVTTCRGSAGLVEYQPVGSEWGRGGGSREEPSSTGLGGNPVFCSSLFFLVFLGFSVWVSNQKHEKLSF